MAMRRVGGTSAFKEIRHLAADRRMHRAFRWLHLKEPQIFTWQTELVKIPAPPFGEQARAERMAALFHELGLKDVAQDGAGNVFGTMHGSRPEGRCVLVSAHIDTVFPAGTPISPVVDGQRLTAPGACDNGAGMAGMLAVIAALMNAGIEPVRDIAFIGNVGEEGDGDLRGMRHVYRYAPWRKNIEAHIVLDGAGENAAVTQALGSLRYRAAITGPGGHSWTDAGAPNPILLLSRAITRLGDIELPSSPRTTLNVGTIEGGTSVNAIPERAAASFDLRSTDTSQLIRLEVELHRAVEDVVLEANREFTHRRKADGSHTVKHLPVEFEVDKIGDRPAGGLPDSSRLLALLHGVDRHLGLRTEARTASTDANIPLSLGVPALTLGAGGSGGGIHTRKEWFDAAGRETGLRRILLLVMGAAQFS